MVRAGDTPTIETEQAMKQIIIEFDGPSVTWHSVGWGNDKEAMAQAKRAINQGETPDEVIELLNYAGFDVAVIKEHE